MSVTTTATEVATTAKPASGLSRIKDLIEGPAFAEALKKALPAHMKPERFIRIALTAALKTPDLMECTQASLLQCLLQLSQYGLEPDGRRAHLIPFKKNKKNPDGSWSTTLECQLIIDWKGVVELVMRSGLVSILHADIVCENDQFVYDKGEIQQHVIDFRKPRGKVYAVYALCRMKDGTEKCDVMSVDEINAIKARSKSSGNGPWVTDWNEMAKKTVFKRCSKWLPLSSEIQGALNGDDDVIDLAPAQVHQVETRTITGSTSDELVRMLEQSSSQHEDLIAGDVEQEKEPVVVEAQPAKKKDSAEAKAPANELIERLNDAATAEEIDEIVRLAGSIPDEKQRVRVYLAADAVKKKLAAK